MSYRPELQPPPPTGNEAFDLWMKRTVETIQQYMKKDRQLSEGLVYDEVDNPTIDLAYMFLRAR